MFYCHVQPFLSSQLVGFVSRLGYPKREKEVVCSIESSFVCNYGVRYPRH